jgi:hypothetical protein
MTIAMFSLIVFSLTVFSALLANFSALLSGDDGDGGWDIDVPDGDTDFHMAARKTETLKIKVKNGGSSVANQPVVFAITTALSGATGQFTEGVQRITTTTTTTAKPQSSSSRRTSERSTSSLPGTTARKRCTSHPGEEKTREPGDHVALHRDRRGASGTIIAIKNRGRTSNDNPIICRRWFMP